MSETTAPADNAPIAITDATTTTRQRKSTGNTGNGWSIIDIRPNPDAAAQAASNADKAPDFTVTIYLRIPPDVAVPIDGGCCCEYCKAHPERVPMWDALAVCDSWNDHSWTVHYPEPRRRPKR